MKLENHGGIGGPLGAAEDVAALEPQLALGVEGPVVGAGGGGRRERGLGSPVGWRMGLERRDGGEEGRGVELGRNPTSPANEKAKKWGNPKFQGPQLPPGVRRLRLDGEWGWK